MSTTITDINALADQYAGGWGLTKEALVSIGYALSNRLNSRVLEFGSGRSTDFILHFTDDLTSFDHNPAYAHERAIIRPLVTCKPWQWDQMFKDRAITMDWLVDSDHSRNYTRARNCFYGLKPGDLVGKYNFVLLDGPFGNGRAMAFLWLIGHLADSALIFIDDADDYPFVRQCEEVLGPDFNHVSVMDRGRYAAVRLEKKNDFHCHIESSPAPSATTPETP